MVQIKQRKPKDAKKASFIFSSRKKRYLSILEKFPYKRIEKLGDLTTVVTKTDGYQVFLKIKTRNIYSISGGDQFQLMDSFNAFCRTYADDFCIYSLMFAANTNEGINFWTRKLQQAQERKNKMQTAICREQIMKIIWVSKNISNMEFYLALYASSMSDAADKVKLATWNGGAGIQLEVLNEDEVEKLLFKLNNMCTEV